MTAETDPFEGLELAPIGFADAGRGAALSAKIGWNQTEADWRYMLENGSGYGCSDGAGRLVASAMALPYETFGWVCMVLVRESFRRRGLATDLMNRVIADLERDGVVPGLDATPAGREVYKQLGFEDIYRLERLWSERAPIPADAPEKPVVIAPMTADEVEEIAGYDATKFGADRTALLRHLYGQAPELAFVARAGQWLAGYILGRAGREVTQIGPVTAEDGDIAIALARHVLGELDGGAVIDAAEHQGAFIDWLKRSGFTYQRPYIRMLRGRSEPVDQVAYVFAVAGPELG
jgi:ribosomal protein S18 acetylase RimI-like enzyme